MKIYSKSGILLAEVNETSYSETFMGERFVTCTVKSEKPIDFLPGDYIDYRDEKFVLDYTPTAKKISSSGSVGDAFQYDLKFVSLKHELEKCMFLDVVLNDNEIHYTGLSDVQVFGNAQVLADRILANLNRLYTGENQWNIEVLKETEAQNISLSDSNCWDAVSLFKSLFNLNFTVYGRKITVGTVGKKIDHVFKYGSGNGLTEITRTAVDGEAVVTRLKAYGGNRNLPRDYNKKGMVPESQYIPNLMLPGYSDTLIDYIESDTKSIYGIREAVFKDEEIYPSISGVTADDLISAGIQTTATGRIDEIVSVEPITKENQSYFNVGIKDIGFNIKDHLTPTTALLSMRDGNLGGYEFEITNVIRDSSQAGAAYKLTLNRNQDDNFILPDEKTFIKPGDHFVLLEIYMPEVYVKTAEQRLLKRAKEYLSEYDHVKATYSINMDKIFMANHPTIGDTIYAGDLIRIIDEDLQLDREIIIQNLTIKNGGTVPEYTVTLSDNPVATTLDRVQDNINDIEQNVTANKVDGVKEARRRAIELQLLKSNIFDPDGEIKDTFLQTMMLQVGANSMNYQMSKTTARPSLANMSFTNTSIYLGTDDIIHFAYGAGEEAASTWHITTPFSNSALDKTKTYFVAIKVSRDNLSAEWIVDENTYGVESIPGYYIFNFGILSAVTDGERLFSETRGNIYAYGDELSAGIISSINRYSWFNLNTGDFQLYNTKTGQGLQFKDGILTLGTFDPSTGRFDSSVEGIINDAKEAGSTSGSEAAKEQINNLEIGGRNLLKNSDFSWPDISMYKLPSDSIYTITRENDMLKIIGASAGNGGANDKRITVYALKPNEDGDYTISFDAYALTPVTLYYRFGYFAEKENIAIIDIGTIKRRYSGTFKGGKYNDVYNESFMWFSGATTIYIDNIQLEKGNKATAYKLAPEDQEQRAADSIEIGSVNLISKKMMLEWAKVSKEIIYWYQSKAKEKPFLKINNAELYNLIGGQEEFKDIFGGKIKYKTNTQYVLSVEWNLDAAQLYTGLIFQVFYVNGGADHIRLREDQTSIIRQDLITRKDQTISKIAISYGTNTQRTNIYNISLIEGNKIVNGFPVAPEDIAGTNNVNLAYGTKTATIPATSDIFHYLRFPVRNIKPNTIYYVNFGNIENLVGNPDSCTVLLYDKTVEKLLTYNHAYNFDKNGGILTTIHNIEEQEGYLLCYAGIKGNTAGISVKFTEIMLVEGDQPATMWMPSLDEAEEKASAATEKLTTWASDNMISPAEKTGLKQQQNEIKEEYTGFNTQVSDLNLTSDSVWTNYKNAYNLAIAALTKYTASTPESINIGSDYNNIAAYYKQKENLLIRISNIRTNLKKEWPVIDATQLDINTYYPVVMRIISYSRAIFKLKTKWGDSTPSWSTHSNKFISAEMTWESNANGWGVSLENRYVTSFEFRWANSSPIGWGPIKQMSNTSHEVIHIRGGAKYILTTENVDIVSLKTSEFTVSGQTVSPQTSITTPVVDVDIAKSTAEEAKVQADSQAYLKEAFQNKTTLQAGLVSTTLIKLGAVNSSGNWIEKAGINGSITNRGTNDIRFYAGGDLASAIRLVDNVSGTKATFAVTEGGKLIATNVEITGKIIATSGEFTGKIQSSVNGDRFIINPADKSFKMFAANNDELSNLSFLTMTGVDDGNDANFASIVLYNRIRAQLLSQPKKTELTAWGLSLYNNYEGSIIDNTGMLAHFGISGIINKGIGARSGSGWTTLYYNKTTGEIAY